MTRRNMLIDEEYGFRHFHVVTEASDEELINWFQNLLPQRYHDGVLGLLRTEHALRSLPHLVSSYELRLEGEDYETWCNHLDTSRSDGINIHLHDSDDSYLNICGDLYDPLNFLNQDVHEDCTCSRCREEAEDGETT